MLMTLKETTDLIMECKLLHIVGSENLLKDLPKGHWVGGSTEYFMSRDGGKISDELLFVTELDCEEFNIAEYDALDIHHIALDAYDNGFSIVIVPFDSEVHKKYAEKAAEFEDMFTKNIIGWVSGMNLNSTTQTPIAVQGDIATTYTDKAIVMHLKLPDNKIAKINTINIFSQDENSPFIEFLEEGFSVTKCLVDGKEIIFSDYILLNDIDIKLPLVGEHCGASTNISFKSIENGLVNFYAPVFTGVKYKMAKEVSNYAEEFNKQLIGFDNSNVVFSCNCLLNFIHGGLEGKHIEAFYGPITFGEIAFQLVNQTLVYVTVAER